MRLPLRGGELERKLVLGLTQAVYLQLSHLYLSVQYCLGYFFALIKNKDKPQGGGESGQHYIGVWEQRGHLAYLRHPASPSYHSKSVLFFQPGFLSPSSQPAFLPLTLFLPTLARKEKDLTDVCKAAVQCGAGRWRLGTLHGVNPEDSDWVRPLPKCWSLGEGRSPHVVLLAVGITYSWGGQHLESICGEHLWRASVSEGFTPGLG